LRTAQEIHPKMALITFFHNILKRNIMEEKKFQILLVNLDRSVLVDLMTRTECEAYINKILRDQPVSYFSEVSRVYIINVETGEVKKPHIKIYF